MKDLEEVVGSKFSELYKQIPEFMEEEDRQDSPFRLAILNDQIGDLNRHVSHDPELNPNTRPIQEAEEVAYGDAIWQLLCLAHSRDVNIEESINHALERLEHREGYHQDSGIEMEGMIVYPPNSDTSITGIVDEDFLTLKEFTPSCTKDMDNYEAILTEVGGLGCHAAKVAREKQINCIVGIVGLTDSVSKGDEITIDLASGNIISN